VNGAQVWALLVRRGGFLRREGGGWLIEVWNTRVGNGLRGGV